MNPKKELLWGLWPMGSSMMFRAPYTTCPVLQASVLGSNKQALSPSLSAGSWVVKSSVISPLIWAISIVALLITLLITTHEPPSKPLL